MPRTCWSEWSGAVSAWCRVGGRGHDVCVLPGCLRAGVADLVEPHAADEGDDDGDGGQACGDPGRGGSRRSAAGRAIAARARRSMSITAKPTRNSSSASGRMLSAMAMWWSSAADFVTLSCSALPLPMASCVLRPATMPSPRTTQPMRSRTRAEQTIAIVPMATRGSNTTGMCTKSGWAGRPANFEIRTGHTTAARDGRAKPAVRMT